MKCELILKFWFCFYCPLSRLVGVDVSAGVEVSKGNAARPSPALSTPPPPRQIVCFSSPAAPAEVGPGVCVSVEEQHMMSFAASNVTQTDRLPCARHAQRSHTRDPAACV